MKEFNPPILRIVIYDNLSTGTVVSVYLHNILYL